MVEININQQIAIDIIDVFEKHKCSIKEMVAHLEMFKYIIMLSSKEVSEEIRKSEQTPR